MRGGGEGGGNERVRAGEERVVGGRLSVRGSY